MPSGSGQQSTGREGLNALTPFRGGRGVHPRMAKILYMSKLCMFLIRIVFRGRIHIWFFSGSGFFIEVGSG